MKAWICSTLYKHLLNTTASTEITLKNKYLLFFFILRKNANAAMLSNYEVRSYFLTFFFTVFSVVSSKNNSSGRWHFCLPVCSSGVQTPHRPEGAEKGQREAQTQRRAAEPQHHHVWGQKTSSAFLVPVMFTRFQKHSHSLVCTSTRRWSTYRRRPAADRALRLSRSFSPPWCRTNSQSQ